VKKIAVAFVMFLIVNTATLGLCPGSVTSFSLNNILDEKQENDDFQLVSTIIHRISDRVFRHYEKCHMLNQKSSNNPLSDFVFLPKDIELKDDAFHGSETLHFTEWWYFDAVLDKGYSIQVSIQVIEMINLELVMAKLNVYHNEKLLVAQEQIYLPDDFYASSDIPLIKLEGKPVMSGYTRHGQWFYDLSLEMADTAAELQFVGDAKGWKGKAPVGGWAVILPKAEVSGTLTINGVKKEVTGVGYHDHNWELTAQAGANFGWYWGKIHANILTATWSSIMKTRAGYDPILVINVGQYEYINIRPEHVQFLVKEYTVKNLRFIPREISLIANTKEVSVEITMTALDVHHIQIGPIKYWRYHMQCTGSIRVDSHVEKVDTIQIAECIRFR